jgi:flagellar protein FlaG
LERYYQCVTGKDEDMTESINTLKSNMDWEVGMNNSHPSEGRSARSLATELHNEDLTIDDIARTLQALKDYIESNKTSLDISVDQRTDMIVVKIISGEDGRVIREIPSEEIIEHAATMKRIKGILFDNNY